MLTFSKQIIYKLVFLTELPAAKCTKPQGVHYNMTYISRDDFDIGYNLTINCDQGFQPVGVTNIMCSNSSAWLPALPDCVLGRTGTYSYYVSP